MVQKVKRGSGAVRGSAFMRRGGVARKTTDGAWPQQSRAMEVVSGLDTSERKKVTPTR